MDEGKVTDFNEWPVPTTKKAAAVPGVQEFLQEIYPGFQNHCSPLHLIAEEGAQKALMECSCRSSIQPTQEGIHHSSYLETP